MGNYSENLDPDNCHGKVASQIIQKAHVVSPHLASTSATLRGCLQNNEYGYASSPPLDGAV